jgi:O-antigen/teichoic acid export membrane protein
MRVNADYRGLINLGRMSGGYFVATSVDSVIPFLLLPVLTRYLSPNEYGNIALFGFYLALSNSLSGISIHTVIYKNFFEKSKEQIARIIGNSMIIVACFSLATLLGIFLFYPLFRDAVDLPLGWLLAIPLVSFAFIVFNMGLDVLRCNNNVLAFGVHQVANTLMNALLSLLLVVVLMSGWQGRVWGIVLAFILSAFWSFFYLKANGYVSFAVSRDLTRSILKIVLPLMPNSFQSMVISQAGMFFIQYYFSKQILGVYAVGFQIAFAMQLLISTLSLSWSPFLYRQLANPGEINRLYLTRLLYTLIGIIFLGVVFINVFSGLILRIMTTPGFQGATDFIPWFTLGFFFHGLSVFLLPILIKHDRQKYISMVSFLNMAIIIGLNFALIKLFGYMGIAYAYALIYFLKFLAYAWQVQKDLPLPWLKALVIWS